MDLSEYKEYMSKNLSEFRMHHSLCVAKEAVRLAKIYGAEEQKAHIAGLLHDICKDMSQAEQLHWIQNSDIIFDNVMQSQPQLWHGLAASVYIRRELKITDQGIINAVRYHTTARENMSLLEKVIYLADYTSEDRDYPNVADIREKVGQSLDLAMSETLLYTMSSLVKKHSRIVEDTYRAYNQYVSGPKPAGSPAKKL